MIDLDKIEFDLKASYIYNLKLFTETDKVEEVATFFCDICTNLNIAAHSDIETVKQLYTKRVMDSTTIKHFIHRAMSGIRFKNSLYGDNWDTFCLNLARSIALKDDDDVNITWSTLDEDEYQRVANPSELVNIFIANPWFVYLTLLCVMTVLSIGEISGLVNTQAPKESK